MSNVYFSSDWHIGHKNIHNFRHPSNKFPYEFSSELEHREWLYDWVNENIRKRDVLYLLGDIAFNEEALLSLKQFPFRIILVKGNHDVIKHPDEAKVYDQVLGLGRYKGQWISHAPIHPQELRGRVNYHGHVHSQTVPDKRYFNCCVENLVDKFHTPCVEYSQIKQHMELLKYGEGTL